MGRVLYQLCYTDSEGYTYPVQFSFNKEELQSIQNHLNNLNYMTGCRYFVKEILSDGSYFDIRTPHKPR